MTITAALLGSTGTNTPGSSIASPSVSPGANRLVYAVVDAQYTAASGQNIPTCSGCSLTWVQVATCTAVGAGVQSTTTVFRAMGAAPTTGAVTGSFGGQTQQNAIIYVVEFDGINTGGTDGSAATVQSAVNQADAAGTTLSATLSSFVDAVNNAVFVAYAVSNNVTITEEGGYTKFTQNTTVTESEGCACAWKLGEDTSPSMTHASNAGRRVIGIEIAASSGSTNVFGEDGYMILRTQYPNQVVTVMR